ncbi:MAG TPA: glycosyltransferase, partial [Gemmatimonadales bacterium]
RAEVAGNPLARAYFASQRDRMIAFEARECRRFDRVVAVSEEDAAHFERAYGVKDAVAVPTGVDTDYFRPGDPGARTPGSLVFVGSMDWAPNEDAVRFFVAEVLPAIRARVPGATLTVVGRDPGPGIRALADGTAGVTVTGTVPDVRPYLASAAAMVVPLRVGGGTRLKIFEAMAAGTPVISTTIGAEGLPLTPGDHLLIGDSSDQLARAAIRLLQDPEAAARMAAAAAALVRSRFGWDAAARAFATVCESARSRRNTTSTRDFHP